MKRRRDIVGSTTAVHGWTITPFRLGSSAEKNRRSSSLPTVDDGLRALGPEFSLDVEL
jgi:hypothetical protein